MQGRNHGQDRIVGPDESGQGLSDLSAALSQRLVPEGQAEQGYFAPVRADKMTSKGRRRPVFLGKNAIEALLAQNSGVLSRSGFGQSSPALSLSAKSGRGVLSGLSPEQMNTYIVRPGDTLSTISVHIYGTSSRWMELAHINNLGNGSIIFPKEVLLYIKTAATSQVN